MKRALLIAVLVVVSVALVGTVFAAEKKAPKAMTFKGVVSKIEGSMITVKGAKGDMGFDAAGAKLSGYKAMGDVKDGDKVTVSYMEKDGKKVATKVAKASTKQAKAPAKSKM